MSSFLDDALAVMQPAHSLDRVEPAPLDVFHGPEPEPLMMPLSGGDDDWLTMPLFTAVAKRDPAKVAILLAAGADPNATLPQPAPQEFLERFRDGRLAYYTRRETGFTVLMLAAALGEYESVQALLDAGADKNKLSKRHRTFALYLAAMGGHLDVMRQLMGIDAESPALRFRVRVNLSAQNATLYQDGEEILTTPISSGKKSKPTPTGSYLVTNKYRDWKSTIYNVKMPYFIRLSCSDFGFHAGRLPGFPASSGCIRLPSKNAQVFFATLPIGTLVEIE